MLADWLVTCLQGPDQVLIGWVFRCKSIEVEKFKIHWRSLGNDCNVVRKWCMAGASGPLMAWWSFLERKSTIRFLSLDT